MSEKHLEELKKICLICGCHTNQAINIYEPRSGPNIVELIQAKFKFQPVNDDKYLCYSCNNWLINWHSLQTLSNESGNQSGKSRSRINDSIPEEETDESLEMRSEQHHQQNSNRKRNGFYFCRKPAIGWHRIRKIRRKQGHTCSICGIPIQIRAKLSFEIITESSPRCRSCRKILKWRAKYSKAIINEERKKLKEILSSKMDESGEFFFRTNLVSRQRHRPLVDGKVIAMLRRLGTTLTRESDCPLMGPTSCDRSKPTREQRVLDEDEVLIDFNTAITEVLPLDLARYKVTSETEPDVELIEAENESEQMSLEVLYTRIPKCVTVSVVSAGHH